MKTVFKKFILSLTILCSPICASAWIQVRATYDNKGYASTVTATTPNSSNKTITSIKFIIVSRQSGSSPFNTSGYKYDSKYISTNIPPSQSKQITIPFNLREGYKFDGAFIEQIGYSDGTTQTYE